MTPHNYGFQTSYALHLLIVFSSLCSYYVNDMIKKLELCLLMILILLKIKFGHSLISFSKIGISFAKAAYIKLWLEYTTLPLKKNHR